MKKQCGCTKRSHTVLMRMGNFLFVAQTLHDNLSHLQNIWRTAIRFALKSRTPIAVYCLCKTYSWRNVKIFGDVRRFLFELEICRTFFYIFCPFSVQSKTCKAKQKRKQHNSIIFQDAVKETKVFCRMCTDFIFSAFYHLHGKVASKTNVST